MKYLKQKEILWEWLNKIRGTKEQRRDNGVKIKKIRHVANKGTLNISLLFSFSSCLVFLFSLPASILDNPVNLRGSIWLATLVCPTGVTNWSSKQLANVASDTNHLINEVQLNCDTLQYPVIYTAKNCCWNSLNSFLTYPKTFASNTVQLKHIQFVFISALNSFLITKSCTFSLPYLQGIYPQTLKAHSHFFLTSCGQRRNKVVNDIGNYMSGCDAYRN